MMLRRSLVRVEVPASRINGQDRRVIERARHWLQDDLRLPDLVVEYFAVAHGIVDQRNQIAEAQADLGKLLETKNVETCGYVAHAARSIANLRADLTLHEKLETLAHEARHVWQGSTELGLVVNVDRREADAQAYARAALPRLRAALSDNPNLEAH